METQEAVRAAAPVVKNESRLQVKDFISIGVYTAIYFVLVTVATFSSRLIFAGLGFIMIPAMAALLAGSIYMLMTAKVPKFGAITAMGIVMGIFFFVSGHFVFSFVGNIGCGIAADLISRAGKYKNKLLILLSYVVFSCGLMGPILPLWFMKDAYIASLERRGRSAEAIAKTFTYINNWTFLLCLGAVVVCALIGGFFGQKMLKKHFAKAGIV